MKKRKEERRKLYLLAARSIFREKGYHEARVKDITDRAMTSVGNFYRYFENKEQVFTDLITEFFQLLISAVRQLRKHELPPIAEVEAVIRKIISIFRENPKIAQVFIEQMSGINEKFAAMKRRYVDAFCVEVGRVIQKFVDSGLVPPQDPYLAAHAWVGSILEATRWWMESDFQLPEEQFVGEIIKFVLRGTAEDPSKLP
ncbi:MAG: TetR/AcrR family transcriptional regulator [Promethearchaeota archaeon]